MVTCHWCNFEKNPESNRANACNNAARRAPANHLASSKKSEIQKFQAVKVASPGKTTNCVFYEIILKRLYKNYKPL